MTTPDRWSVPYTLKELLTFFDIDLALVNKMVQVGMLRWAEKGREWNMYKVYGLYRRGDTDELRRLAEAASGLDHMEGPHPNQFFDADDFVSRQHTETAIAADLLLAGTLELAHANRD